MTNETSSISGAGYSGTPLLKKLGIKPGLSGLFVALPETAPKELSEFGEWAEIDFLSDLDQAPQQRDYIHIFEKEFDRFSMLLPLAKSCIRANGMIWISWPKKASRVPSTMNENLIRKTAIATGLVDIKVCAVDRVWSGLKLVIPVKYR